MRVPTPIELGLPEKFHGGWRPTQVLALEILITNPKRIAALCMPTGSGKSPVIVGDAVYSKEPSLFVTWDKGLQDQYYNDFASIGMVDIRGASNYQCEMRDEFTCEDGASARCPLKGTAACPRSNAEMRAATSSLVVTNYSKWIASKKYGMGMSHFKRVYFDEGHKGPDAIAAAMQVVLHHKEIEETLQIPFPRQPKTDDVELMRIWKSWALQCKEVAQEEFHKTRLKIQNHKGQVKTSWVKHMTHMGYLSKRLSIITTANANNWIVDQIEKGYVFDPIRPGRYGEAVLMMNVPKVTFVSATMPVKTLHMTGIGRGGSNTPIYDDRKDQVGELTANYIYREFDSDFDPKDCPIYWIKTMRIDSSAEDLTMAWIRFDQWASPRMDKKGIVQTVSHGRRESIMARSRFGPQMMFNERGELTSTKVEEFKVSPMGTILVSPSISTGYDFPGDQCEWTWICKVPFEPPSKIVKARQADDKEYRGYRAIQYLEQAAGRHVRYGKDKDRPGDRGETAIPDDHMSWFYLQFKHLASRSFRRRYVYTVGGTLVIPKPLPKL